MTDSTAIAANAPLQVTIYPQPQASTGRAVNANASVASVPDSPDFWGQGGVSFKSFLDTINPLQHIPGVSSVYQAMTGDIPSSGANITGGLLFGGPIGLISSIANEITKTQTGQDIGGNIMTLLQGVPATQTAQNDASDGSSLSANQRASYNAYVRTQGMMG